MNKKYSDCTLVNPLCPGDLCELWYGHKGTTEHKHLLGTMPSSASDPESSVEEVSHIMFMAPKGTNSDELISLGIKRSDELWPEKK
jgi:hypothetical protein